MTGITLDYVEALAFQLSAEEQQLLAEHLTSQTKNGSAKNRVEPLREDLYGLWRGKFPDDLDIEKGIREIRDEWKKELEEYGT